MIPIEFKKSRIGNLDVILCQYNLTSDIEQMSRFSSIFLHNTYKFTDVARLLDFHRQSGYAGIGYHFAISPSGTVYCTRPLNIQGAHVFGRNKESVGVVFLDVDACAKSPPAKLAFRGLYDHLSAIAGEALVLHSHTSGQFDYLNQRVDEFNKGLEGRPFPYISYDEAICRDELLFAKKAEVVDAIIRQRRNGIPKDKSEQFSSIVRLADGLKACPGQNFAPFKNYVQQSYVQRG